MTYSQRTTRVEWGKRITLELGEECCTDFLQSLWGKGNRDQNGVIHLHDYIYHRMVFHWIIEVRTQYLLIERERRWSLTAVVHIKDFKANKINTLIQDQGMSDEVHGERKENIQILNRNCWVSVECTRVKHRK